MSRQRILIFSPYRKQKQTIYILALAVQYLYRPKYAEHPNYRVFL